jgi:hypothetical protein
MIEDSQPPEAEPNMRDRGPTEGLTPRGLTTLLRYEAALRRCHILGEKLAEGGHQEWPEVGQEISDVAREALADDGR